MNITEVQSSKDLKQFINLPWDIYKNDKTWVPPLKISVKEMLSPKHPFYETAKTKGFVAHIGAKVVGRIFAVVNNHHNSFHDEKIGFWGFFEAAEDETIAGKLLETAEAWLKSQGMEKVQGPVSPSTNYECGLLVEGFEDSPQIMMTYNPKWYADFFESKGYTKAQDLLAYNIDLDFKMPELIVRISDRAEKSHKITYRPINMKKWDEDIRLMLDIYNTAWEKNWGFIPMTEKEFLHTANDLKMVVDPNLIIFVMVGEETAGFIVTLPDYNQIFKMIPNGKLFPTGLLKLLTQKKKINRVRTLTMGIKEKFRHLGLASLLYQKSHQYLQAHPTYKFCEMSWVLEDNINMNKPLQRMGAKVYKRYRIYQKEL